MGRYEAKDTKPTGLADALFPPVLQRVLGLLFGQPERRFQSAALIRLAGSGTGATHRVLQRLAERGLVRVSIEGRQKYYQANPESPVFDELVGLAQKSLVGDASPRPQREVAMRDEDTLLIGGTLPVSRAALRALVERYHIRRLVLFGSAARGELTPESDIDLLVEFEEGQAPSLGGMVEIQDAFSELFGGRKVDVTTASILENPYRRRAIERDMEVLYAA